MKRPIAILLLAASAVAYACAESTDPNVEVGTPETPTPPPPPVVIPESGTPSEENDATVPRSDAGSSDPCGDGTLATGEECDDGNNASDDGCSASCKRESTGPDDVCPGLAITLTGSGTEARKGSVTGSTSAVYRHYAGSCGGFTGQEAVYVVNPDVTGLLTATLTRAFDSLLYVRRACDDPKTEAACKDIAGAQGGEEIRLAVTQNQPVYLFVDGASTTSGTFTLDVEVATAFCGNGIAEAPEACDDGNAMAGDGCAADCSLEPGGNIEDCPGQGVTLTGAGGAPRTISFAGSTATMPSSTVSATGCTASGKNTIYSITADVDGSMKAKLVATYDNATLHIRSECDTVTVHSQLDCREATEPFEPLEIAVPVKAGYPYYVIVDSSSTAAASQGPYNLDVTVTPGQCGNKVLDGAEQCDDGNAVSGDGCTATCTLEPVATAADTCPGATLPLVAAPGGTFAGVVTSSTALMTSDFKPKTVPSGSGCSTTNSAKDAVYVVTSPISGLLTATVSGTFDSWIYARTACDADAAAFTDLGCAGSVDGNGPETITVPIAAGTPVYVIVDGDVSGAEGLFELGVTVTPAACGNGIIEGGEQCDDANVAAGDGCDASCQLEPANSHDTCANAEEIPLTALAGGTYSATVTSGTTNLGHHQTFSGCSSAGPDAIYTIKAPIDGVLTAEVPVAGFNVSLGGRTTCPTSTTASAPIVCSNVSSDKGAEEITFGVTKDTTYYLIVDGAAAAEFGTFTMLVNVRPSGCGDSLISGGEQCDDGNTANGDGCSATCTVEALAGLDTCPGYTLALTGAGNEPRTGVLTVDTSGLTANYAGTCGGSSKDGVVVVTPPIAGKLTAKLTGITYQPTLYARTICADAKSEPTLSTSTSTKACDDDAPTPSTSSRDFTINVTAGTPYYLFLDGYNGAAGIARLNVTVTP